MKTAPRALFYTAWTLIFATIGLGGWLLAQALGPALAASRLTLALVVWAAVWLLTLGLLTWRLPEADLWFLPPAALLNGWGLLLIARTAQTFLWRQVAWSGVSCAVLTLLALTPALPRWLRRYRYTVLAAGLILLLATFGIGVNPSGYGPRLWLGLAGFYFQPSELLKIMLVVYLAAYLAERREALVQRGGREWHLWPTVLGPMLSMIGLALVLLAWQQDLGAALLFSLTFLALLYLAWGKVWPLLGGTLLLGPILTLGTLFSSRVALRVSIWLDPWAEAQADRAFQIRQALFALGAGGLIGQGPGWGAPNFVPVVHTDFPYVALVEEYGLIGAAAALLLIAWLVSAGLRVAQRAQTSFESLLAGGQKSGRLAGHSDPDYCRRQHQTHSPHRGTFPFSQLRRLFFVHAGRNAGAMAQPFRPACRTAGPGGPCGRTALIDVFSGAAGTGSVIGPLFGVGYHWLLEHFASRVAAYLSDQSAARVGGTAFTTGAHPRSAGPAAG